MERPDALFERTGRTFRPTVATLGPWREGALHGGPVAGLLAHGILAAHSDPEYQLARLTVDMPRSVHAVDLELNATVIRSGRRVVVTEARLAADGQEVARATGLLLRPSSEPDEPNDCHRQYGPTITPLEDATPADLPARPFHHANCIGLRRARRGGYWVGITLALVAGEPIDPVERAAIAADWANAAANFGPRGIAYINPDITMYLHRPPTGIWLGVGPATRGSTEGIATADCPLVDSRGVIGRCIAAGLSVGYSVNAPGR